MGLDGSFLLIFKEFGVILIKIITKSREGEMIKIQLYSGPKIGEILRTQQDIVYSREQLILYFYCFLCHGWDWNLDFSGEDDKEEIERWLEAENLAYYAWLSKNECRALTIWQGPFPLVVKEKSNERGKINMSNIIYVIQEETDEPIVIYVIT